MGKRVTAKADKAGIASAVLCTIHCLVVPVLFLIKFYWGESHSYRLPAWWGLFDLAFLFISFMAVYHSAKHTTSRNIRVLLWIFWGILTISIIFEAQLHWMAYIASTGLIGTHLVNIRRIKRNAYISTADENPIAADSLHINQYR